MVEKPSNSAVEKSVVSFTLSPESRAFLFLAVLVICFTLIGVAALISDHYDCRKELKIESENK